MTQNSLSTESEKLIQFFLPHLTRHIEGVTAVFAKAEKKDLSDTDWLIILNETQSGKFLNHHYLSESWTEVESYLRRKTKLFCFLAEKQEGLVGSSYTFWVFFSPTTAAEYFKSQLQKPKNFSAQAIRQVPFPKLQDAFLGRFDEILNHSETPFWQKLEQTADILKLSDRYLDKGGIEAVDQVVKRKTIKFLSPEIEKLQEEIVGPNASSSIVARRLKSVLRIGWRYFRAKNELETKYFRKLLSEEADERIKGLKLAKKKLIDFELEMAE